MALGERVVRGQALAVIDSPDLAQAYDDNDKAADSFKLTDKILARQQEQSKIGTASDQDLDQAKSNCGASRRRVLENAGAPENARRIRRCQARRTGC